MNTYIKCINMNTCKYKCMFYIDADEQLVALAACEFWYVT